MYHISCRTKSPGRTGSNVAMNVSHIAAMKDGRGVTNTYVIGLRTDGEFAGNVVALKATRLRNVVISEVDGKPIDPKGWWLSKPSDSMSFLEQVVQEDMIFLDEDAILLEKAIVNVSLHKVLGLPEPVPAITSPASPTQVP